MCRPEQQNQWRPDYLHHLAGDYFVSAWFFLQTHMTSSKLYVWALPCTFLSFSFRSARLGIVEGDTQFSSKDMSFKILYRHVCLAACGRICAQNRSWEFLFVMVSLCCAAPFQGLEYYKWEFILAYRSLFCISPSTFFSVFTIFQRLFSFKSKQYEGKAPILFESHCWEVCLLMRKSKHCNW